MSFRFIATRRDTERRLKVLDAISAAHQQADKLAPPITVERLFAYVFGVLAGADYTERFHDELETPGPRVPLSSDPALFESMAAHGEQLLWLQTFGERFTDGRGKLPLDGVNWKSEPTRLPDGKADLSYDTDTQTLRVADGTLVGVSDEVWRFSVSGMPVISKWLGYRMAKPAGRAASSSSPLDHIRPTAWLPEWNTELVEIVAVLKETLALRPAGVALLDEIVAGPLVSADELPAPPPALRQPPTKRGDGNDALFSEEGLA